jgi:prepilin-type processing-associated H-X9-DG protein
MPAEMFAIGESRLAADLESHGGGVPYMIIGFARPNSTVASASAFPPRHGKNYNQLFCDAHVEAIAPLVLFDPTKTAVHWNIDHQPHPETW